MAEIICIECKEQVSDTLGYCPNCGYPFDLTPAERIHSAADDTRTTEQLQTPSPDVITQSLEAVRLEMNALQKAVADLRQDIDAQTAQSQSGNQQILTEIVQKLDTLASITYTKEMDIQKGLDSKSKKNLLAAFYKSLNSPNSMFEYMFYLCVVQAVFVIVILFVAAYIVTLVR